MCIIILCLYFVRVEYVMAVRLGEQNILIVEDQEGPRAALMMILRSFYRVDIAETAQDALEVIVERPVDLVIMDIGLPDFSGVELLRRVRASGRNVKVIVMSGGGSIESADDVMRMGAVAYLLKPFNFQEVLNLVQSALQTPQIEALAGVSMSANSVLPG